MRIFDPHAHMTSRTTDDYEAMHASGVRALVEPGPMRGDSPPSERRLEISDYPNGRRREDVGPRRHPVLPV